MAKLFILDIGNRNEEIKNKSLKEFLTLFEDKYEYFYDEPFGSFNYAEMLDIPIEDCNIMLGKKGKTVFGFRFYYAKEYKVFIIRVLSPSTTNDWETAIEFIIEFGLKFESVLKDENGQIIEYEELKKFDYFADIKNGIEHIKEMFGQYNMEKVHLGTRDILTLDIDNTDKILNAENPILEFDKIAKENREHIEMRGEQNFYVFSSENGEKGLVGYYDVEVGKDFVLKLSPSIEPRNNSMTREYGELETWLIEFKLNEKETMPLIDYYFLLNNLPKEKIRVFGYDNIYVEGLTRDEVDNIYKKTKVRIKWAEEEYGDGEHFITYDNYRWYYTKVVSKELKIGRLATINHMAYFLRFCMEKGMMSDYFKTFYNYVDKYLNFNDKVLDFRELILYSFNGKIDSLLLNEKGQKFAKLCFIDEGESNLNFIMDKLLDRFDEENKAEEKNYFLGKFSEKNYLLAKQYILENNYNKMLN